MRKRRTREMLGRVSPHLGSWLVSLRTRSGLTQAQLAERAKVSRSLVSAAERGEIPPSVDALASLARPLGAPTAALLALAGYAPDPLGRAVADMEASFLRAARGVAAGTAALLRAEFSRPTSGVRLAAQHLAYRRRLAGLPVEEALARAAPLDAPPPATVEAAEAAASAPEDETVLKRLALMDSERWVGWSIGVGGDPDLVLWLIGRLPDELIDAAGLGPQMAARRKALERALELDRAWASVGGAQGAETGEDADLITRWREGGLWAIYDALLARSLARTEASADAGGEDGAGKGPDPAVGAEGAGPEDGDLWRALSAGGERAEELWGALSRLALEEYRGLAGDEDRTRLIELILFLVRWAWWGRGSDARVADYRAALRPAPDPDGFAAWLRRRDEPLDRLAVGLGALVWRRMDLLWPVLRAAGQGAAAARAPLRFRLAEHPDAAPEDVLTALGEGRG